MDPLRDPLQAHGRGVRRPLRLLIYGLNFAPELTGIGKYTGEMAMWLAERGHHVRVITAPPYYPNWRIPPSHGNRYSTEHPHPRLTVFRCPLYVPPRPSGIRRLLHLASFAASSLPVLLRESAQEADVLFTVEPTFFGAPGALLAGSMTDTATWLHVQDFEVDAAFELGLLPSGGVVQGAALGLERTFARRFALVSSISANMLERAREKGVPASRTVLFPNWVDIDRIRPEPAAQRGANEYRRELGLGDQTLVLYSGNMGAKQGLEMLPALARSFALENGSQPPLHFLFCGDGAFRPQLEASLTGSANVTLLPLQPVERLNGLLNAADIHLLPQRAGAADLVMPSKLTGMLASGRPVIATAEAGTQLARVVSGAETGIPCGLVTAPDDLAGLVSATRELASDPERRRVLGAAGRGYAVERLGAEHVLRAFEEALFEVAR